VEIDFQNPVHLRSADHRGRVQRKASARKACPRTARNERNAAAMERRQYGAQLRGRTREQKHVGGALLDGPSVALVNLQLGCARDDPVGVKNSAELIQKFAVDGT